MRHLAAIAWHWDPLKTVLRSGLEKNMNNDCLLIEKNDRSWDAKRLSCISLFEGLALPSIQQKYENIWQNCSPKPSKIVKRLLGAVRVDLLIIFIDFGPRRKIAVFDVVSGRSKIDKKSSPGAPRGRQVRHDWSPKW